jgi:hypothetical protein
MQYSLFNRVAIRSCGVLALAACASFAWAAPQEAVNDGVTAAVATAAVATAAVATVAPAADGVDVGQLGELGKLAALPETATDSPFGPAADLDKLEASRGGTDVHNDMKLDGVVSGNSAVNVVTGSNSIDTGAFANMSGIPVVIQNSGANVLIQSATIVNLQFK